MHPGRSQIFSPRRCVPRSLLLLVVLFLVVSPSLQNESLGFQTEGESLTSRFIEQYLSEIEKFKAPGMQANGQHLQGRASVFQPEVVRNGNQNYPVSQMTHMLLVHEVNVVESITVGVSDRDGAAMVIVTHPHVLAGRSTNRKSWKILNCLAASNWAFFLAGRESAPMSS